VTEPSQPTEPAVVPRRGPGRPPKPRAPRSEQQARLFLAVNRAEDALEVASAAYMAARTVTNEVEMRSCELSVASAWAAYLRASGDFTNATRCSSDANKITGDLCRLRELVAIDQIGELKKRAGRVAASKGGGK
jgi:hypothetical protein